MLVPQEIGTSSVTSSWPGSRDQCFWVKPPSIQNPPPPLTRALSIPLTSIPKLFRLITPNVILIKNGGVKGFSLPEKRVQLVAQWQTPSLAWEEIRPDIARVVPTQPEPG